MAGDPQALRFELEEVRSTAAEAAAARKEFSFAILRAHALGHSYRKIAEVAGVSYETVRRMVKAE